MNQKLTLTEKQFMAQVKELAVMRHWRFYHPFLSVHSERGWPDATLVRPPRIILAELKSAKGKVTPAQAEWLELLAQCDGLEVYTWFPKDWDQIVEVLL